MTTAQAMDVARATGIEYRSRVYRSVVWQPAEHLENRGKTLLLDCFYSEDVQQLLNALTAAGFDAERVTGAHRVAVYELE